MVTAEEVVKKVDECPRCGEDGDLRDFWQRGRKLQQECRECGWKGPMRTPETITVRTEKKIPAGQFGGWHFEVFDRYGHLMHSSRYYSTEAVARAEMEKACALENRSEDCAPVCGVLWPSTVVVTGELYTPPVEVSR